MSSFRPALRPLLAALALAGASALLPRVAAAQADSVIHACYVPTTGSIYRIKTADTPSACTKTGHVAFDWRRNGYAGATIVSAKATMPAPSGKAHQVLCPPGRTAISGGYTVQYTGLTTRTQQLSIGPVAYNGQTGWGVGIWNPGPSPVTVEVKAVCVAGG
jgi:hypothetical protein